jgi:hypothetical protein
MVAPLSKQPGSHRPRCPVGSVCDAVLPELELRASRQASVAVMASVQMIELPGDTGFGDRGKRIETTGKPNRAGA